MVDNILHLKEGKKRWTALPLNQKSVPKKSSPPPSILLLLSEFKSQYST
jgi:hypothetical protein